MLLSEAIEALAIATIARGRSPRTVGDYRQKLGYLLAFLGDVDVAAITIHDLRSYVASLYGTKTRFGDHSYRHEIAGGLSPATVAGRMRTIKRLFSFLYDEEIIDSNPSERLEVGRLARGRVPKAISDDDLRLIIEAARDNPRDYALVHFLADTGCRRGGLVGLQLQDLDLDHRRARVTEKGDKTRTVFLSETTAQAMADWLAVRPIVDHSFVWTSHATGAPLTGDGVSQVLRRLGKRAGCKGPHGPHAFRHAFARTWIHSGGDIGTLADVMGHSDVSVTWQAYAVFKQDELQRKHALHSPIVNLDRRPQNE